MNFRKPTLKKLSYGNDLDISMRMISQNILDLDLKFHIKFLGIMKITLEVNVKKD